MKPPIIRFIALFLSASLLFALSVVALSGQMDSVYSAIVTEESPPVKAQDDIFTVIVDAGHGGEDGGAQGLYGTCEKDLNLAVALKTAKLLTDCGVRVILTRDGDYMLGDGKKGTKKLSDLRARVDIANGQKNALLISIHMNKFPLSYCKGVQIFYSPNDGRSLEFANVLHSAVKEHLEPEKTRALKEATSAIYLLDRVRIPAVLIECGFLSNEEEAKRLTDDDCQYRFAALILCALSEYLTEERNP
ncbi:MAG: N-acetylmuramoyl-L-alanine amidase [Clostridia bacterium]|nr:N-acetylmuramoyl-L-alanine amidase [Clostridia bacterium]